MVSNQGNRPSKKNDKIPSAKIQKPAKIQVVKKDLSDRTDDFFTKNKKTILYLGLGISLIISVLLFDVKVSVGGDDSSYIKRAYDVVHGFLFPGFQGPLYPLVLSLFIRIAGLNLILLKIVSLVCMLASLYLFYKSCSGKLPQAVVSMTFLLLCVNGSLLYYSSQTYSEAFYLLLQSLFFWYAAKKFTGDEPEKISFGKYLMLGFLLFLLTITRNIAFMSVGAIMAYFVFTKKWKSIWLSLGGFLVSYILFEIIKRILWGNTGIQISTQASAIMYKNFYNPSLGTEDLHGMISRYVDNANLFFSRHVFNFVGLRTQITTTNTVWMLFTWVIIGMAFYRGLRKNKLLLLIVLYSVVMCSGTFIALQKEWNQSRMIIIYLPFFLIMLFSAIYYLTKTQHYKALQFINPVLAGILLLTTLSETIKMTDKQKEILSHNLEGDMLYGLTPDWKNYILMSQWAAQHTPTAFMTVTRKPDISFIYSGREFAGITKVPTITPDSLLRLMKQPKIYVGIQMKNFMDKPLYGDSTFRSHILSFVNGKFAFGINPGANETVAIFGFTAEEWKNREPQLKQSGAFYDTNIKTWIGSLTKLSSDFAIYVPDFLLNELLHAKVKYMLLASLRANPSENNGNIINTLHRYAYFIQMKYPNMFKAVRTIGSDESAQLVEINKLP